MTQGRESRPTSTRHCPLAGTFPLNRKETMRAVTVFKREQVDGKWQNVKESDAIFHCFSTDHEEYQEGPGPFPVAVVEFPDGSLASRHVDLVRFTEPTQA